MFLLFFLAIPQGKAVGALYEEVGFDRIILVESEGGGVFDIFPIEFPNGRKPQTLPRAGELKVRFVELPGEEYMVYWSAIESVITFDELVFRELQEKQVALQQKIAQLSARSAPRDSHAIEEPDHPLKNALDEVFGYYDYLFRREFSSRDFTNLYRQFLSGEANYYFKIRDWTNAVARLERLYTEQRNFPGLSEMWGRVFNEQLKELTEMRDFFLARRMIQLLQQRFPDHPTAKRWEDAYTTQSKRLFSESQRAFDRKDYPLSFAKLNETVELYPQLPGIKEQAVRLHRMYPSVHLGVSHNAYYALSGSDYFLPENAGQSPQLEGEKPGRGKKTDYLILPGAIRVQRLLDRPLLEQVGFQMDGAEYQSPFGTVFQEENGKILRFRISENLDGSSNPHPLGPVGIANGLRNWTDPEFNAKAAIFSSAFESMEIEGKDHLYLIRENRHVLPECMLRIPFSFSNELEPIRDFFVTPGESPRNDAVRKNIVGNGPFVVSPVNNSKDKFYFFHNETYPLSFTSGPKLIEEISIRDTQEGLMLLRKKRILALDRIAPWEISQDPEIARTFHVARYANPTIHLLVPNRDRPLPGSRTFRRALLYGLNREMIVHQFGGRTGGVEILSGPFPRGSSETDPQGYGYDMSIAPRIYDPKLSVALCLMSLTNVREKGLLKEEEQPKFSRKTQIASDMPEIVLAHPENTACTVAAQMIARQWEMIGIPVRLVSLSPDEPIGRGTRVDFWYVPVQITEPMFDILAVLSQEGLVGSSSVYMELALEKLRRAEQWPQIVQALQGIHRLCTDETTVLSLWQWRDILVYHKDLSGVMDRNSLPGWSDSIPRNDLIDFYQNIEHWTAPFIWDDSQE